MAEETAPSVNNQGTLLFIDDEPNILSSLERLFWPLGYNILTAEGGEEALALLEKEQVDLLICDMRMPGMSGAEVLEQAQARWPDVARILLTGYADLDSAVAAINRGGIYRYIAKPWDDNDITLAVHGALERKRLLAEKKRLEALTQRQNEELKRLNITLEDKVLQRTIELRATLGQLEKDYFATLNVFANLMELHRSAMAGYSRRIAQLCRDIAQQMRVPEAEIKDIEAAALLCSIGKIGVPDRLLDKPYAELTNAERIEFDKYPLRAAAALMALEPLQGAAGLIRYHRDHYDGACSFSGLRGEGLPLGARILLVASDYEMLQEGEMLQQGFPGPGKMLPAQALDTIAGGSGTRYDPAVVNTLRELVLHAAPHIPVASGFYVTSAQLQEGMLLTHDVAAGNGMLLLLKGTILNAGHIRELRAFMEATGEQLHIYTHSV